MSRPRLRVQLQWQPANGPPKFWWQPSSACRLVSELLEELNTQLLTPPTCRLAASMDGFAVLPGSRIDLLRDGDLLLICMAGRKRTAAEVDSDAIPAMEPADGRPKRLKAPVAPAPAPAVLAGGGQGKPQGSRPSSSEDESSSSSSSSEEESSSDEETSGSSSEMASSSDGESSSSGSEEGTSSEEGEESSDGGEGEPAGVGAEQAAATPAPPPASGARASTAKKPSRSARRKAAKRRLRRMGLLSANQAGLPEQRGPAAAAAAGAKASADVTADARQRGDGKHAQQKPQQKERGRQAAVPVVTLPREWQQQWEQQEQPKQAPQPHHESRPAQQQGQLQLQQPVQQQKPGTAAAGAVAAGLAELMSEAAFAQLAALDGLPSVGDVLAYRLLEVGPDMQPGVSEVRLGRVVAVDAGAHDVTLAPHPDPATHPLSRRRAAAAAQRRAKLEATGQSSEEETDEEDDFDSQYNEDGTLVAHVSAFVDLRVVQRAAGGATVVPEVSAIRATGARQVGAPTSVAAHDGGLGTAAGSRPESAAAAATNDLGPSHYSQLGPPRPASARGDVIAPEGGWAALYEQLRQRRLQLAEEQTAGGRDAAGTPHRPPPSVPGGSGQLQQQQVHSAPPASRGILNGAGRNHAGRGGSLTPGPGATRPRAGVRRTALGPMLRMLREAEQL